MGFYLPCPEDHRPFNVLPVHPAAEDTWNSKQLPNKELAAALPEHCTSNGCLLHQACPVCQEAGDAAVQSSADHTEKILVPPFLPLVLLLRRSMWW